jgi:DNA repair protein RecN (Recombination protein N)
MLTLLKIRNLALVDELIWELGPGLIGVTGETGAGKSVIVGALKLVLGERADKSLIRSGEDQCLVEAVFELRDADEINSILEDGGLNACEDTQLIVRRVIGQNANRQFINDSPVTLNLLKRVGEHLVDLHGPHDHQSLLSTERQLAMLDAYAGAQDVLGVYRDCHRKWRDACNQLGALEHAEQASATRSRRSMPRASFPQNSRISKSAGAAPPTQAACLKPPASRFPRWAAKMAS